MSSTFEDAMQSSDAPIPVNEEDEDEDEDVQGAPSAPPSSDVSPRSQQLLLPQVLAR